MIGTLINVFAILAGTGVGLLVRKGVPERMRETVMQGLGLCVLLIGVSGAIKTADTLCVIISIVVGGLIGSASDGQIVGCTNAVNLIDGLDGLAVGVSAISSMTPPGPKASSRSRIVARACI